jgi:hypothetical protein
VIAASKPTALYEHSIGARRRRVCVSCRTARRGSRPQ